MSPDPPGRAGFALITVMLVVIIVALLATSAAVIGSAHVLGNRYYDRQSQLDGVALEGLELWRARINGDKTLYPDDGYATLESGVTVNDGDGNPIPGVHRWVYAGPTGSTSGQYGVFGSIVAVARDDGGGAVVRRVQVYQESFAKYAYFTDVEPSNISFGGGDQIFGPVHTNDYLKIYSSGASFFDETTTAKTVQGAQYGTFKKGYEEHAPRIEMPKTTELTKLKAQAQTGNTAFAPGSPSGTGEAYMRIEFIAIDLNGDGSLTGDNEGFFRVYQANPKNSTGAAWLSGDAPSGGITNAANCGDYHSGVFTPVTDHSGSSGGRWSRRGGWSGGGSTSDTKLQALTNPTKRCYLGGADSIAGGFQATDSHGGWVAWPGAIPPEVAGRDDAGYLFPLARTYNPSFKGVIYFDGKVVVSGTLRGRVTIAATDEIIIGDDILYANSPALGTCADILGLFSGTDIVVADNMLNAPQNPGGSSLYTYDDTSDEFIDAIALALNNWTVEDYDQGDWYAEPCGSTPHGRGCLFLTGGIIQETRGAVGTVTSTGTGTGYVKRYAYDKCGASDPPPYFPTTGHFVRGQVYLVDPAGFDVAKYFQMLTSS